MNPGLDPLRRRRDSPDVEAQRVARFRVPDSPFRVSPEQAGADHVAFFGSLAAAEMWGPGMEDGLAAWAAGAAEPDEIEIFLSAGPVDAINSCNVGNQANCRVYRVRWSLSSGAVVGTPDLVSPTWKTTPDPNWTCGFVEPEVEVETGQLAMVRRCFDNASGDEKSGELHIGFPRSGGGYLFTNFDYADSPKTDRPQWPAWLSQRLLVFERARTIAPSVDMRTMYAVNKYGHSEKARAGYDATNQRDYSFGNPRPFRGGGGLYGPQSGRIVSFGLDPSVTNPVPHTHDRDGNNLEMFDLPILDANGVNFESCHHPDWNSDGTRIMCTRHKDEEVADGRLLRQLHEFAYDASSARWGSVGALMAPISLAGVPAEVYPSGACDILTYKYARYVGSNHVLATVFCSTIAADVTGSRVMLIENPTAASPIYHDITTEVEIAVGAARGSWRGVFGSWGAVS